MSVTTHFQDLGVIEYKKAWDYQKRLFDGTVQMKFDNRKLPEEERPKTRNYLLFCEHPHVYTLGKSGDLANLLINEEKLKEIGATYYPINRGGDITYHGPGQIVAYPIFDLDYFFTDIHKYLRFLEDVIIKVLEKYGLEGQRSPGETGVWPDVGTDRARKICAMGIQASRCVTMHGFAFNVNSNLEYFGYIVPCGITDKAVTSLDVEVGRTLDYTKVKQEVKEAFAEVFDLKYA